MQRKIKEYIEVKEHKKNFLEIFEENIDLRKRIEILEKVGAVREEKLDNI